MANQYVNKVIVNNEIKMDLTEDTITPNTLRKGFTAHDASGAPIVGNESLTDISEDGTNAGPILKLNAEGWAEQTKYTGKNLLYWPQSVATLYDTGITVTINSDGFSLSGTKASGSWTDVYFNAYVNNAVTLYAGQTYVFSDGGASYNRYYRFADASHTIQNPLLLVSISANATSVTVTPSSDITFDRMFFTIASNSSIDVTSTLRPQLELGSQATEYEPYCGSQPSPNPNYPQEIKVARGRNLFDKNNVVSGVVLSSDGSISTDAQNWRTSDYIYVHGMSSIVGSGNNGSSAAQHGGIWYAKDKTFLSWFGANAIRNGKSVSVPPNAYYVRVSSVIADLDTYQLEEGSVPTPYVPYGHVGMEVQGRNLLDPDTHYVKSRNTSITTNGVTFAVNNDGTVTANGTASEYTTFLLMTIGRATEFFAKHIGDTLTLSGCPQSGDPTSYGIVFQGTAQSGIGVYDYGSGVTATISNSTGTCQIYIRLAQGCVCNNLIFRPMLELGSTANPYEPYYHSTIPIPLPSKGFAAALPDETSDILKLDGAGGYEWTNVTNEVVLDGSTYKSTGAYTYKNGYRHTIVIDTSCDSSTPNRTNFYTSHFIASVRALTDSKALLGDAIIFPVGASGALLAMLSIETAADVNTWLSQNPVTVLYPLATPTTELGYVNDWNNDFPLGCTIDIPELRNINVEYFLYDSITQLADDYYDRTTNDISSAMSQTADSATLEALTAIAPIENDISSANYAVGSYLIHDGKLCQVTQAIAANETITVGTNVILTDVGNELDELNDAVDEINANPYILPTMSESEKGGAKVGEGLSVSNDILNVDMLGTDPNDAGPLLSLQAEGWAEQTQLSGKNLLHHNLYDSFTARGVTLTKVDSTTQRFVGTTSSTGDLWVCPMTNYFTTAGTYTFSITSDDTIPSAFRPQLAVHRVSDNAWLRNAQGATGAKSVTFTLAEGERVNVLGFIIGSSSVAIDATIHFQIEAGSTATSYEPYCGGIPSPNPDYPQDIRVVRSTNLFNARAMVNPSDTRYTADSLVSVAYDGTITGLRTYAQGDDRTASYANALHRMTLTDGIYNITLHVLKPTDVTYAQLIMFKENNGHIVDYNNSSFTSVNSHTITFGVTGTTNFAIFFKIYTAVIRIQIERESYNVPQYAGYNCIGLEAYGRNLLNPESVISSSNRRYVYVNVKPSTTYTISSNHTTPWKGVRVGVHLMDSERNITDLGWKQLTASSATIQTNADTKKLRLLVSASKTTSTVYDSSESALSADDVRALCLMVEHGSTAHSYEPYNHKHISIPLPSKGFVAALPDGTSDILRLDGAGGYEWTNATNEKVFEGSTTDEYGISNANGVVVATNRNTTSIFPNNKIAPIIASHGTPNTADYQWNNSSDAGVAVLNNLGKVLFLLPTSVTTIDGAKTWLAFNPVTILYPLATPIIEKGYLPDWDNCIPIHATIDIPELRNIGVECYLNEESARINSQWSKRLKAADDISASNGVTESLASLAPVEGDISSANYTVGSYLIHDNQLYKVTAAIATGEVISTNTNITSATIANELLDIDSDLLDFSELLEAAKAEYREKFQAIDSWQAAASQLIREDNGYYSNESITRMLAQRFDGKLYGYSEPKTTAVAITKTGANAGLANPTLGTATVAGSSAYRHLGPFQWFAAKGIVDSDGVPHVSTIKGIDSDADWNADTNNVWSLRPIQWYSIDSTGGTVIGSLSDTWHLGLKPNPQAYLPDGTLRPYMLAPRYALGFENGVGVSKSGLKGYGRDVSHNSLITKLDYANTGYSGKTIYENWYDIFMSRMIYGTKDFQTIMQGCTSYNYQYHPSVAEQDTTRVILSNANAANLVVGSTMMMGNQATESTYRNNVNAYNIFDGLIIESITEYDADNKSIELSTDTTFSTDPAYLFSTAPWHSGSCDTMDWDGSPTNPQSAKECAFFQGCELMTGVYEVLANIILKGEADARQIPYIVYSSRDDATSVTANFVKCGDGLLSNDGTASAWKYPLYIADHNGLLYGEEAGGSTIAGCADGQYVRPNSDATNSEWPSVGTLWLGRNAGLSYVHAHHGVGSADWDIWSRLSPVGLSRG